MGCHIRFAHESSDQSLSSCYRLPLSVSRRRRHCYMTRLGVLCEFIFQLSYVVQTQQVYSKHLNIIRYHIGTFKGPYAHVMFLLYIKLPHSPTRVHYGTVRYRYGTTVPQGTLPSRTVPYHTDIGFYSTVRNCTIRYFTVPVSVRTEYHGKIVYGSVRYDTGSP
jgi:hypothetical protein